MYSLDGTYEKEEIWQSYLLFSLGPKNNNLNLVMYKKGRDRILANSRERKNTKRNITS